MKNSMLEYSKLILEKVSFDKRLFWKEYKKLSRSLVSSETHELKSWIRERYI
jgi:hypothetical protein